MEFINGLKIANAAGFSFKKYKAAKSTDGPRWSGDIYLDGKKIGSVAQDGTGGPVEIDMPVELQERLKAALLNAGYILDLTVPGTSYVLDEPKTANKWLELVLSDIANDYDKIKYWKTQCKVKTCAILKKHKPNEHIYYRQAYSPELAAFIRTEHGDELIAIVNEAIAGL